MTGPHGTLTFKPKDPHDCPVNRSFPLTLFRNMGSLTDPQCSGLSTFEGRYGYEMAKTNFDGCFVHIAGVP